MGYDQPMTQRHNAAFPAPFGVYCWQRWEGPPGRRLPPVFPQRCAVASVHVGGAGHCFLGLNGIFHANTLKPSGAFMPYQRWCLKPLCLRKALSVRSARNLPFGLRTMCLLGFTHLSICLGPLYYVILKLRMCFELLPLSFPYREAPFPKFGAGAPGKSAVVRGSALDPAWQPGTHRIGNQQYWIYDIAQIQVNLEPHMFCTYFLVPCSKAHTHQKAVWMANTGWFTHSSAEKLFFPVCLPLFDGSDP